MAIGVAALAALVGCGGNHDQNRPDARGNVTVAVRAVTSQGSITRVSITVMPADVSQDLTYNAAAGTFSGVLLVPAGEQTLTATAYMGAQSVGTGSATVTVAAGKTASVQLEIIDTTGAPPVPDHVPYIASMVVPRTLLSVGEAVELEATGVDIDGDPITYAWSESCSSGVTGTFSTPTAATTSWSADAQGTCTLTLTVEAKQQTASRTVEIAIFPAVDAGSGAVSVNGRFIEHPVISALTLRGNTIRRSEGPVGWTLAAPTQRVAVYAAVEHVASNSAMPTFALTDNCGGSYEWTGGEFRETFFPDMVPGWELYGFWVAPSTAAVCTLTATTTLYGMTDSFPIAVLVGGCLEDDFEPNDTIDTVGWVDPLAPGQNIQRTGLRANNDDWYAFYASPGTSALEVLLTTTATLELELYAADKFTRVATGTNALGDVPSTGGLYYLHVKPPATEATCGPSYDLSIAVE